jgi:uncharacterized protein YjiS (DUF1127 family)
MQHTATSQAFRTRRMEFDAVHTLWTEFRRMVIGAVDRASTELRFRKARRQLRAMDDHMLRDIAVARSEIEYVARNGRGRDAMECR